MGLIRRACGGEPNEEDTAGIDSAGGDGEDSGTRLHYSPPHVAFEVALEVCMLCERPDAGLEVLRLMRSTDMQPLLEAYKVGVHLGEWRGGGLEVTNRFGVELKTGNNSIPLWGSKRSPHSVEMFPLLFPHVAASSRRL